MKCKSTVAVILGAILIFALGATRAAFAAPPADPCSLLTPAQIQKVLGQPFGAPGESKWPPAYGKQNSWRSGQACDSKSKEGK